MVLTAASGQSFATGLASKLDGNRTVELLNFGLGAFKQPQTTLSLAYFLMLGSALTPLCCWTDSTKLL